MGIKTLWASLIALIINIIFFEFTNVDLFVQEYFYLRSKHRWILNDPDHLWRAIFYSGIKDVIIFIGVLAILALIISFKKNIGISYQKGLIIVVLSLAIIPFTIAVILKNITNIQCPYDLSLYTGERPYVKLFEPYPKNPDSLDGRFPKGHCYPAGHASGGFALFGLVCLFKEKRNKILAFIFSISCGWVMGGYQLLRGAHFIGHQMTTMILSLLIVCILNVFIKDLKNESSKLKK